MKKIIFSLAISCVLGSCTKNNTVTPTPAAPVAAAAPTADFKISNPVNAQFPNAVYERVPVQIENISQNGATYLWNFGSKITSTDKVPTNAIYQFCGAKPIVTLTVTGKDGKTATCTKQLYVQCSGKHANTTTTHLNGTGIGG